MTKPLETRDVEDSWACAHVTEELTLAQRRQAFQTWLQQVKAEAWEQGERAGYENAMADQRGLDGHGHYTNNPYRKETRDV